MKKEADYETEWGPVDDWEELLETWRPDPPVNWIELEPMEQGGDATENDRDGITFPALTRHLVAPEVPPHGAEGFLSSLAGLELTRCTAHFDTLNRDLGPVYPVPVYPRSQ